MCRGVSGIWLWMRRIRVLGLCFLVPALLSTPAVADGRDRISLSLLGSQYGFPAPVRTADTFSLRSKDTSLVFEAGSRKLLYNGVLVWLNDGARAQGAAWTVSGTDARGTLDPLLRGHPSLPKTRPWVVLLDPGHGGRDTGAIGHRRVLEKKVALDIAKRVRSHVEARGRVVRLTRDLDLAISLSDRVRTARELEADLFVSLHLNSARNRTAVGAESYVCATAGFPSTSGTRAESASRGNGFDGLNMLLAYHVHRGLLGATVGPDRGIKRARFEVLRSAACPAVLVECGFVSNPAEEDRLISRSYRESIARGIASGIEAYLGRAR